jgi:hypothetical protein
MAIRFMNCPQPKFQVHFIHQLDNADIRSQILEWAIPIAQMR